MCLSDNTLFSKVYSSEQGCYKLTMDFENLHMEVQKPTTEQVRSLAAEFKYQIVCGSHTDGVGKYVDVEGEKNRVIKYFSFERGGQQANYSIKDGAQIEFHLPSNPEKDYEKVADVIACSFIDLDLNDAYATSKGYMNLEENSVVAVDSSGQEKIYFDADAGESEKLLNFLWNSNFSHMVILTIAEGHSEAFVYVYKVGTGIEKLGSQDKDSTLDGVIVWIDEDSFIYSNSSGYFRYNVSAQKRLTLTKQGYEKLLDEANGG